jgi:hypothetical protein
MIRVQGACRFGFWLSRPYQTWVLEVHPWEAHSPLARIKPSFQSVHPSGLAGGPLSPLIVKPGF